MTVWRPERRTAFPFHLLEGGSESAPLKTDELGNDNRLSWIDPKEAQARVDSARRLCCLPRDGAPRGLTGNAVRTTAISRSSGLQSRGCPRNCKRKAKRRKPLAQSSPGRRRAATTREPGDLPSTVVTRERVGRGAPMAGFGRSLFAVTRQMGRAMFDFVVLNALGRARCVVVDRNVERFTHVDA